MGVTYSWTPVLGGSTYTVKIVKLEGKILAGMEADSVYREGVKMELDIRSVSSYAFTTTSTTTTLL